MDNKLVAFIGIGHIGLSWAARAVANGFEVRLWDAMLGNSADVLEKISILSHSCQAGDMMPTKGKIEFCESLEQAVQDCPIVFECITEDLPSKRKLFQEMEQVVGEDTILASTTSSFPTRSLFRSFASPQRCIITHPMNPPHLIPLVEIIPHQKTSKNTLGTAEAVILGMGQFPITLQKEIEGFVVNRLQAVLLNEAMRLVALGVCTATDIDDVFKQGFAPRWARRGPIETANMSDRDGFAGFADRMGKMMNWIERQHNNVKPWNEKTIKKVISQLSEKGR